MSHNFEDYNISVPTIEKIPEEETVDSQSANQETQSYFDKSKDNQEQELQVEVKYSEEEKENEEEEEKKEEKQDQKRI